MVFSKARHESPWGLLYRLAPRRRWRPAIERRAGRRLRIVRIPEETCAPTRRTGSLQRAVGANATVGTHIRSSAGRELTRAPPKRLYATGAPGVFKRSSRARPPHAM